MIRYFASMRFAYRTLIVLVIWMCLGGLMAGGGLKPVFKAMNDLLVLDWFLEVMADKPLQAIWFIGFCILGALVLLSFIACTFTTLWKKLRQRRNRQTALVLFSLHLLFTAILLLHVISMTTGFKNGHVRAFPGDTLRLSPTRTLVVDEIRYAGSDSLLRESGGQSRIRYTRANLKPENSFARVTLLKNGKTTGKGTVRYMEPYREGSIFVCLEAFVSGKKRTGETGVRMTIVKNPVIYPFFVLYALSVLLILIYTCMTWNFRKKPDSKEI
ncbi:MAG TPA: hypothetical protein P5228_04950 [Bacteroidales bacterium]|nr:hypothetical protein [Bacteroidales bacterium]HRZ50337.1 hypothetical protein [Bacteroidales bacterium]